MNPYLLEALRFYRPLGFFADRAPFSDQDLAEQLEAEHASALGLGNDLSPLVGPGPKHSVAGDWDEGIFGEAHPEVVLLALDTSRVWWQDLEWDFVAGSDDFVRLLEQWSAISRGAFVPTNIREYWPENDRMYIEFELEGKTQRLVPWAEEETAGAESLQWVDIDLINVINYMIAGTGYSFHLHEPFDQTAFLVVLDDEEVTKFEGRGWIFAGTEEE